MGGIPNRRDMHGNSRKFASVKLEKSVIDRARVIAAWRQVSLGDYLSDMASQFIERDSAEMIAEMSRRAESGKKGDKGGGRKGGGAGNDKPEPGKPPAESGPTGRFRDPNIQDAPPPRKPRRVGGSNGDRLARGL